jgi:membrane protein
VEVLQIKIITIIYINIKLVQLKIFKTKLNKSIVSFLISTGDFYANGLINHGAALAFYFILSLIPVFLLTAIIGNNLLSVNPDVALGFFDLIQNIAPNFKDFIEKTGLFETRQSMNFSFVSVISLIFAASLFSKALTRCFSIICNYPKNKYILSIFLPYILTFISIIFIIIVIIVQILSHLVIKFFWLYFDIKIIKVSLFILENLFLPLIVIFVLTFFSYIILSYKKISFFASFYGSFLLTFFIYMMELLFNKIYKPAYYNHLYGSVSFLILFLLWFYVIFVLFLFFANFAYIYSNYNEAILNIINKHNKGESSILDILAYHLIKSDNQ